MFYCFSVLLFYCFIVLLFYIFCIIGIINWPAPRFRAASAARKRGDVETASKRHIRLETADVSGRRFAKALEPDPIVLASAPLTLRGGPPCLSQF